MDTLELLNKFAGQIVDAMNAANITPLQEKMVCGLLVVVHRKDSEEEPIGGSINFEAGKWKVMPQAQQAEPYEHYEM
jgi:hypothetical protein